MKKLVLAVAVLAISFSASAQITFGVKAGANLSTISDMSAGSILDLGTIAKANSSQSMKIGFNAGVFAEYKLTSLLGIQVEVLYSLQGVKTTDESSSSLLGTTNTFDTNWSAAYVNIPVLAKVHFGPLAVYAGPQFGFVGGLNAAIENVTVAGGSTTTTNKEQTADKDAYNAFDLSVAVGASYMVTRNIGVDARYNIGMTNVFAEQKDNDGKVTAEAYGKNGSIQVGVFYAF